MGNIPTAELAQIWTTMELADLLTMARLQNRRAENVRGPFYVDSSCIDCGTCWQWDPQHFEDHGHQARVWAQPQPGAETERALLAAQACPVAAIGATPALMGQTPTQGFPALITPHPAGDVYYCGWASRKSYGASSYLVVRPQGNVLIDSPRYNSPLKQAIAAKGGLAAMVLSHRDDVADHRSWAHTFGCPRWIHHGDRDAVPDAEHCPTGEDALWLQEGLQLIPTPGHTAGSMVAVLGAANGDVLQVLFSGDHLWWSASRQSLWASKEYCWGDWHGQVRSLRKLQHLNVGWLLPGHGSSHCFQPGEWQKHLKALLASMA